MDKDSTTKVLRFYGDDADDDDDSHHNEDSDDDPDDDNSHNDDEDTDDDPDNDDSHHDDEDTDCDSDDDDSHHDDEDTDDDPNDDDSHHEEDSDDDLNLESGVVLASLWLSHDSCHCLEIHSISQGELSDDDGDDEEEDSDGEVDEEEEEDDDEDEEDEDEDEDEVIQLLKWKNIASPPLLTPHSAVTCNWSNKTSIKPYECYPFQFSEIISSPPFLTPTLPLPDIGRQNYTLREQKEMIFDIFINC